VADGASDGVRRFLVRLSWHSHRARLPSEVAQPSRSRRGGLRCRCAIDARVGVPLVARDLILARREQSRDGERTRERHPDADEHGEAERLREGDARCTCERHASLGG
jgi:hypothetical protein